MNGVLEQINSIGEGFVEFAWPMLVQSSVLIAILLLIDFALRKRVRAVFRYWIWMLVLVKLILPTSLSSPVSLGYWFGEELRDVKVIDTVAAVYPERAPQVTEVRSIEVNGEASAVAAAKPSDEPIVTETVNPPVVSVITLTLEGVLFLVWLAVVVMMGGLLVQRAVFVSGLIFQAKSAGNLMTDVFEYCCGQMGLKGKVGLKVSANATSPAVCGLFRPVILVPGDLAPSLGASRLRAVLLHELAHIKRGDLWVSLAQTVLQILYFYNPLLWAANFVIRRVREQAVDEAVQVVMGEKAREYPQTLVEVAKLAFKRPTLSLRLIGVVESKSALKGRIKRMLSRPIPRSAKLGAAGLLAVIVAGAVLLPMAGAESGPPGLVIKGIVTDAKTGQPIEGAQVFDDGYGPEPSWDEIRPDKRCQWGAITNSKGEYSFLTWPEHHSIKVVADGYKDRKRSLYDGHFTLNKKDEEVFDFTLELERSEQGVSYSSVTVEEGLGFGVIIVGDSNCTGEFIKFKLGEPDKEVHNDVDWWLNYGKTYGLGFWVNPHKNILVEIRLNKGFKGKLTSGISVSSSRQKVFDIYGEPIRIETPDDFDKSYENGVLYHREGWFFSRSKISKIYYEQNGLLFWFEGNKINQIVVYRKGNTTNTQPYIESNSKNKSELSTIPEGFVGHWKGRAKIIVNWTRQRWLSIDIEVMPDGKVTGRVGDSELKDAVLKSNRGWLGKKLNIKTDWIIRGDLIGPIIKNENIKREYINLLFDDLDTDGKIKGGFHTSGKHIGDKKTMVMSGTAMVLEKTSPDTVSFSATLANGVTVELVSVCKARDNQRCWAPDGSLFSKAPYYKSGAWAGSEAFEFAFRVKNLDEEQSATSWKIDGKYATGSGNREHPTDEAGKEIADIWVIDAKIIEGVQKCDISFGVAAGPWQTQAKCVGIQGMVTSKDQHPYTFSQAYVHNNMVCVTVSDVMVKLAKRLIAIDNNGNTHLSELVRTGSTKGLRQSTFGFKNLKLEDVKEFQFQTQPYEWTEFKNVSLRPNFKTDVEIEVEKAGHLSQGVVTTLPATSGNHAQIQLLNRLFNILKEFYEGKEWAMVNTIAENIRDVFRDNEEFFTEHIGQDITDRLEELSDDLHDSIRDEELYLTPAYYDQLIKTWNEVCSKSNFKTDVGIEVDKAAVQVGGEETREVSRTDKMASEDLAAEGWALWQQRKLAEAEKVFKEAVAKDPTSAGAWNGLGWSQFNQGKRLHAKVSFQKCLEIEPNHAAALNGLGWIAKGEKKIDEAIGYWEKAVESAPGATAALSGLTQTYMELKQYDNAIKYYQMWLNVKPDNTQAKTGLEKAKAEKDALEVEAAEVKKEK